MTGLTLRAPRQADVEAVTELLRACDVANYGEPDTSIEDVRDDWGAHDFDLSRDAWLLEGTDGSLLGYGWLIARNPNKDLDGDFVIRPGESTEALGPRLVEAIERRALEVSRGEPIALAFFSPSVAASKREVLERHGYREVRTYFRMMIGPDPPATRAQAIAPPAGIEIRPARMGLDDREIHATIMDSFAEHFRHTSRPFEGWWSLRVSHERFDPAHWYAAWEGDRMAGALIAYDFQDYGFVRELGVRKPWRGRGIGKALLTRSFRSFRERGQPRIALGVDAENEDAVQLYVRVGMRVEQKHFLMQKRLGA